MKIVRAGHEYLLNRLDGENHELLNFVNRDHGCDKTGTTNQEVLRVLIDRVKFLDSEVPWVGNATILQHLRMALVLHESRHLERAAEKGKILPEEIVTSIDDGHFKLT